MTETEKAKAYLVIFEGDADECYQNFDDAVRALGPLPARVWEVELRHGGAVWDVSQECAYALLKEPRAVEWDAFYGEWQGERFIHETLSQEEINEYMEGPPRSLEDEYDTPARW